MIVDVHGHVTHPELFERFPMPPALADIDGMLEQKAEHGIELTIVGSPVGFGTMMPVPGLDNYAQPLDQLKSFHGWLAETVEAHAGRLAAYAYTNPFGGGALLEQTAATVREGGFVGLIVNSSVQGRYLDSEGADEFFEMAAELGVPVFLHPGAEPVGTDSVRDFRVVEQVSRFFDVAVSLATLAVSGRLEQYPDLKLIAATAGGAAALIHNRLDAAHGGRSPAEGAVRTELTRSPSEYLRNVYVDTANGNRQSQLANLELMGPERMLFGTDSPPLSVPLDEAIAAIRDLPVPEQAQNGILEGNARKLFALDGAAAADPSN
jgi:predicted TIM-barrel fold metal-dependent hydrolase